MASFFFRSGFLLSFSFFSARYATHEDSDPWENTVLKYIKTIPGYQNSSQDINFIRQSASDAARVAVQSLFQTQQKENEHKQPYPQRHNTYTRDNPYERPYSVIHPDNIPCDAYKNTPSVYNSTQNLYNANPIIGPYSFTSNYSSSHQSVAYNDSFSYGIFVSSSDDPVATLSFSPYNNNMTNHGRVDEENISNLYDNFNTFKFPHQPSSKNPSTKRKRDDDEEKSSHTNSSKRKKLKKSAHMTFSKEKKISGRDRIESELKKVKLRYTPLNFNHSDFYFIATQHISGSNDSKGKALNSFTNFYEPSHVGKKKK
jgi:hypothetical protein